MSPVVKFDELRVYKEARETPKLVQLTIKYSGGLIKNEKQSINVIIFFIIIIIFISISLFINLLSDPGTKLKPVPVTGREQEDTNWPPLNQ